MAAVDGSGASMAAHGFGKAIFTPPPAVDVVLVLAAFANGDVPCPSGSNQHERVRRAADVLDSTPALMA